MEQAQDDYVQAGEADRERPRPRGLRAPSPVVRVLASLALLTAVGTFVAAQVDFIRRNTLGFPPMDPRKYWLPQIHFIWVRGLGAALLLGAAAFGLHRVRRGD